MKVYENVEEKAHRFGVFSENLKEIRRHNLSGSSWKKGINQFTDLTTAEFHATLNGYVHNPTQTTGPVREKGEKRDRMMTLI